MCQPLQVLLSCSHYKTHQLPLFIIGFNFHSIINTNCNEIWLKELAILITSDGVGWVQITILALLQVLFGAISDTEKVLSTANRQPNTGKSEQHNVLPLHSTGSARFPLLPVISDSFKSNAQLIGGKTPNKRVSSFIICNRYHFSLVFGKFIIRMNLVSE